MRGGWFHTYKTWRTFNACRNWGHLHGENMLMLQAILSVTSHISVCLSVCLFVCLSLLHCHKCVGLVAQWITRLTTDQKIPGSNPGKIGFSYRISYIFSSLFSSKFRCSLPLPNMITLQGRQWIISSRKSVSEQFRILASWTFLIQLYSWFHTYKTWCTFNACRQLRPSSRREHVNASSNIVCHITHICLSVCLSVSSPLSNMCRACGASQRVMVSEAFGTFWKLLEAFGTI